MTITRRDTPAQYTPDTTAPPPRPLWRDVVTLVLRILAWVAFLVLVTQLLRVPL